jgi:hypothetical protein
LEKTEECGALKLKMKEMEIKIEKLEETVKGFIKKVQKKLKILMVH